MKINPKLFKNKTSQKIMDSLLAEAEETARKISEMPANFSQNDKRRYTLMPIPSDKNISITDRIENVVTNGRGYDSRTYYSGRESLTEEELQFHLEEMEKPALTKASRECYDYLMAMYGDSPGSPMSC